MTRKVFFSFDYDNDVRRVEQIRNCGALDPQKHDTRFIDAADREKLKRQTKTAIADWIDDQLAGTSVTVVLFGSYTHQSEWVRYEIEQSVLKGNGLLGIDIHRVRDPLLVRAGYDGTCPAGANPLGKVRARDQAAMAEQGPLSLAPMAPPHLKLQLLTEVTDAQYEAAPPEKKWEYLRNWELSDPVSCFYNTYDWVLNNGRGNIANWIEAAAKKAGR